MRHIGLRLFCFEAINWICQRSSYRMVTHGNQRDKNGRVKSFIAQLKMGDKINHHARANANG